MAEYVQRELLQAPDSLVTNGKINFGTFRNQFRRINYLDADKPLGFPLPGPLLSARLKEWQAFQLGDNRWFMLAVLYNAKVSALAQFIVYDKENKKKYAFEKILPSWQVKVPNSIWNSSQSYKDHECMVEIISLLEKGRFYINIKLRDQKNLPDIEAHFELFHDAGEVEPMVVSIPFGRNRGMYSHKCLMPMQGALSLGDEKIDFARRESFAFVDDHKGFYPYVMKYDWATAAGFDDRGQLSGFNLTDNQSLDAEKYNENCLWINGKLHLLPPVKFSRPGGVEGEWLIRDNYGMVDLTFKPVSMGIINMNLLFLRVDYKGPFGYCNGFIRDSAGNKALINQYFGMGEDKYIRG